MELSSNFYSIALHKKCLEISFISSWDDQIAGEYISIIEFLIKKHLLGHPWGILVDLRQWTLHTPEAETMIAEHFAKGINAGLSCVAIIQEPSEIKKWQLGKIAQNNLPKLNNTFTSREAAMEWFASYGFSIEGLIQKVMLPS